MVMLAPLAISVGLHLAVLFGLAYTHSTQSISAPAEGSKPAATIKAVVKLNDAVSDSAILAAEATLPASVKFDVKGPYSVVFNTSSGATWGTTADTPEALVAQLRYCPSHVCTTQAASSRYPLEFVRSASFTGFDVSYTAGNFQNSSQPSVNNNIDSGGIGQPRIVLKYQYGAASLALHIPAQADCPAGYTFNAASSHAVNKCELTDAAAAQTSSAENGVCLVDGSGIYDASDSDCARLVRSQHLQPVENGVQIRDNPSNPTVATTITSAQGEKMVSLLTKLADGAYSRQDAQVGASGQVGSTAMIHYPNSPPPAYPGDTTGIGTGTGTGTGIGAGTSTGGSTGGGGSTCGGPGQPACQVEFASGSGSESPGFGTTPDFSPKFSTLTSSTLSVSGQCPRSSLMLTLPVPAIAGGPLPLDGSVLCDILDPYDDLMRQLSIILGFVGATFIVLRA